MAAPTNVLDRGALPAKVPHRFGLKSVATVTQQPNGHWMFGSEWQEACGDGVFVAPNNCDPLVEAEDRIKTAFALGEGSVDDAFTLYAMHQCSVVGGALISERTALAMDELNLGEWNAIEQRFMDRVLTEGTTAYAGGISGAKNAFAAIMAGWDLGIEPTIHVTPNVAVALDGQFQRYGNHLEHQTIGGKAAVGFGYDAASGLADASEGYIALTGPVFGAYGNANDLTNEQVDVQSNTYIALVERPYVIGYLCKAIYVKVNDVGTLTA